MYSSTLISPAVSTGRMTNQSTANQSNTNKVKEKEENQQDDNTEVAYKDAGYCSRNTHNLLLGLTVLGMHGPRNSHDIILCLTAANQLVKARLWLLLKIEKDFRITI